jgi:hypothetical protein
MVVFGSLAVGLAVRPVPARQCSLVAATRIGDAIAGQADFPQFNQLIIAQLNDEIQQPIVPRRHLAAAFRAGRGRGSRR